MEKTPPVKIKYLYLTQQKEPISQPAIQTDQSGMEDRIR